ncbi:thiosulfohydrolase SoxB [Tepidimonas taiwanensis]|uniref:Mannosylglucosyl-3-phosphoglycerate phosphatase n=1 Tax=Tepidimonas taiwanensis TaxID=307486 RepID=A0A554XAP4_9BURK|nr:thiosulfohydrolase SoxB [Tepidimonas taiwanensis]MCX7693028.1 thiosulfohydrolase SoxB [Tepidimonas taiwanensis]MDM7463255.1 thiosulfohydrolase SoxB [Tepidimonas taiwanensis]TSE32905.1 Mannosylglucosyl-3-phosphoglycerate phosphatase [Tepidimonas taiwanensis]UBQ04558.1 thiosulfohydrolase SoxB [Tepidimonas taiwanensis]
MSLSRREFLQVLAVASASGMTIAHEDVLAAKPGAVHRLYDVPKFGNVSFLHFTDCHAQLIPVYFREPSVNLGVADAKGRPPHLVGEHLLKHFGIRPGTPEAHAFTYLDFSRAAKTYGKVGGFAHLATLVKMLRASRPHALLCDGGDTWQGSATSLWTNAQDMVDACKRLGVNIMTPHWEFTFGAQRVKEIVEKDFKGHIDFVAHNVKTADFEELVFEPYVIKEQNGIPVAVIGQAFPYTPIANPRWMVPDWTFGIRDDHLQKMVDEVRAKGAQVVVVLSHNGMDVDIKMASRVRGVDAILGGHTHDGMPAPVIVKNAGGQTLVTNAGSNGKFLGVLDFDVRDGKVRDFRYKLLPVFSNLLPADREMAAFIEQVRAPYKAKLEEKLAVTEDLLYRRGNFNGSWDQVILDALMEVKGADAAFSPGVRWGTSLLPGDVITYERMMDQMALTYPTTTLNEFTGAQIKEIMEDIADNLFNPDPYYQQGGDMVRVGGLTYTIDPTAPAGQRIQDLRFKGEPLAADKKIKVAGWASVQEGVQGTAEPIWDVVSTYLRDKKVIRNVRINTPKILSMAGNPGLAA